MRKIKLGLLGVFALTLCACASGSDTNETNISTEDMTVESSSVIETTFEASEIETTEIATTEIETELTTEAETTTEEETTVEAGLWETEEHIEPDFSAVNKVYEESADTLKVNYDKIMGEKKSPVLNITTQDGKTIKDKVYYPVVIDLFNCDEEYELTGVNAEVKVRGNSSANSSPYPYRIKLDKKANLLGLHDGAEYKNWVLLKPYWTFCPNFLALNLAKTIFEGDYYVSDCEYVSLYMNGKYLGLYLLCEQNQVNEGRVEVNQPEYGNTDTEVGYFIEMDNNAGEDHPFFKTRYKERKLTDMLGEERELPHDRFSVISDICCDAQLEFIQKYVENVYEILWCAIEEDKAFVFDENYDLVEADGMTTEEAVKAVIDERSFLNMLFLEELVQNYDVGAGSFYFCVDLSEGAKYNRLTLTCPWDFNWAYERDSNKNYYASTWQKMTDSYDRSNPWFILLMKAEWFRKDFYEFVDRFNESGAIADTLKNVGEHIEDYRDDLGGDSWMVDKGYEIMNFVKNRLKFLVKESESYKEK